MHEEWTDKLSDYLDGELPDEERRAVDAHLRGCAECAAVLNDLKRVIARAQGVAGAPRPPAADLWAGIAARIETSPRSVRLSGRGADEGGGGGMTATAPARPRKARRLVPRADWGEYEREAVVQRLDLPAALARWG